jgi:hypothetical protein
MRRKHASKSDGVEKTVRDIRRATRHLSHSTIFSRNFIQHPKLPAARNVLVCPKLRGAGGRCGLRPFTIY